MVPSWKFAVLTARTSSQRGEWHEQLNEDEYERAAAAEMGRHAFEHEVECYGIADGQHRRPHDPAYVHWPSYLMGHRTGLAMPAEPDNGE